MFMAWQVASHVCAACALMSHGNFEWVGHGQFDEPWVDCLCAM